jgi:hypothetical protein
MVRLKVSLLCRGRAPPREFCVASGNVQFDQVHRRSWTALFGAPGWDGTSLSGRETSMRSCVDIVAKKEAEVSLRFEEVEAMGEEVGEQI